MLRVPVRDGSPHVIDHPEGLVAEDEARCGSSPAVVHMEVGAQMALDVTRMSASVGSSISASGTSRTLTDRVSAKTTAFMSWAWRCGRFGCASTAAR
jgi:hypothetical protein